MNPQQALQLFNEYYMRAVLPNGTGADHVKIQMAVEVINNSINPKPVEQKPEEKKDGSS